MSEVTPEGAIPSGSAVMRDTTVIGMYLNKLRITGGRTEFVYGRIAISTEIARYLSNHSISTAELYTPPTPTIKRSDDSDTIFQLEARVYSSIGARAPALAVEPASALVKIVPDNAQTQLALAVALTGAGKFEDAMKALDAAAKLDPRTADLENEPRNGAHRTGEESRGRGRVPAGSESCPRRHPPAYSNRRFLHVRRENARDKALTYAQQAVTAAPNSPATLLLVARVQKRQKNYQAAEATIVSAMKMAPEWADAYYALGSTFESAGDTENAEKAYVKLVGKQPKNPAYLLTLASFYADHDKKDDAAEQITKIRALNPPKPVLDAAKALEDKMAGKKPDEGKDGEKK